jgi:hypothetical protein
VLLARKEIDAAGIVHVLSHMWCGNVLVDYAISRRVTS